MRAVDLESLRRDLVRIVGARHVTAGDAVRTVYGFDAWPRSQLWRRRGAARFLPDVVVWPGTTDEVVRIVRYARERHVPITAYGAGSNVVGGALAVRAGITVDFKRLRQLLSVDLAGRQVTAQAGIVGQRLVDALERQGLTLGHRPDSLAHSTLGGWVSTRSFGASSSFDGGIASQVVGLTAVAGTGEVLRTGVGRTSGPDLVQLLCGSEGTLALITEATLLVRPKPVSKRSRRFRFRHGDAGLETMRLLMRAGLRPHRLTMTDAVADWIDEGHLAGNDAPAGVAADLVGSVRHRTTGLLLTMPALLRRAAELTTGGVTLEVGFEAAHRAEVDAALEQAADLVAQRGGTPLGEVSGRSVRPGARAPFVSGPVFAGNGWMTSLVVGATWERLPKVADAMRRAVKGDLLLGQRWRHAASDGAALELVVAGPAFDAERAEASMEEAVREILRAAQQAGATASHHQGIGLERARLLPDELGDPGMRLLRAMKAVFDPAGILNPGKLLG